MSFRVADFILVSQMSNKIGVGIKIYYKIRLKIRYSIQDTFLVIMLR
jgi:hypothetical protein